MDGRVADATAKNWVDRFAPPWSRPWLRLSRADRPAGTWLLLIPCWWGLMLAAAAGAYVLAIGPLWLHGGLAAAGLVTLFLARPR